MKQTARKTECEGTRGQPLIRINHPITRHLQVSNVQQDAGMILHHSHETERTWSLARREEEDVGVVLEQHECAPRLQE